MSTNVYTGPNTSNFIRKHLLQICLCLSALRHSERTVQISEKINIINDVKIYFVAFFLIEAIPMC